ncbi:hypothetical protein [Bradyrhizobium sp. SZCCHNS1012]|uniref:hypothetical protein n=1 Tax=Bradyrhizobium sp. SZCCHNS1012 TaxID=3057297 RepID=UPI002916AB03|nr:hypothetical protein [Bradyrhizobium sp. SZCCHNS1012]
MLKTLAARLEGHPEQSEVVTDLAMSLAAQMPGTAADKQKICEFMAWAVEWVGDDSDSRAKRNALALAAQMPADYGSAISVCLLARSIISVLFGGGGAG